MTNNNDLISVILPVYNTEQHLDKSLSSLLNQTYRNCEFILIDDGSSDSSGLICDKWQTKDNRIRVVHQKNQGVTAARNVGVSLSTGKWITFLDSDDALLPDAIKIMHKASNNCDIVLAGIDFNSNLFKWPYKYADMSMNSYTYVKYLLTKKVHTGPVARLFKKTLFTGWELDIPSEIKSGEDWIMNVRLGISAVRINQISDIVYVYNCISHDYNEKAYIGLMKRNLLISLNKAQRKNILKLYFYKTTLISSLKNKLKPIKTILKLVSFSNLFKKKATIHI